MAKLEITLGDALFSVEINFDAWQTSRWQDTTHFHVDSEIHIILDGDAIIEIDGRDVRINSGDVCLLAPKSSHYPKNFSKSLKKINFTFSVSQNYVDQRPGKSFSEYVFYSNIFKSVDRFIVLNDKELSEITEKLISAKFSDETEHIYKARLATFFIALASRIGERGLAYSAQSLRGVSENENFFRQRKTVEEFFQKRYSENVSIEDLAAELCLSVPHTHRIVKKVFDGGFKKNLMKQRIEHACMLIKQNEFPLTEIAFLCGYTSYNGFLSAFKSYTGKAPKEYEKSIK